MYVDENGLPQALLYVSKQQPLMEIPQVGRFLFEKYCIRADLIAGALYVPALTSRVFGLWLEWVGRPVLHAAVIARRGRALALLGQSGQGKSTLTHACLAGGATLLCDDLLPLEQDEAPFSVSPGMPFSRLWPQSAAFFYNNYHQFSRVHPQLEKRLIPAGVGTFTFTQQAQPLAGLVVLKRQDGDQHLQRPNLQVLSPARALIELIGAGFCTAAAQALKLQPRRLAHFARLLQATPVYQLNYPSGLDKIAGVADYLSDHLLTLTDPPEQHAHSEVV